MSIKLDLEDRRAAYKYKRQNINTDNKLFVSDTHYSFDSHTYDYKSQWIPTTIKLDRTTLKLDMTSDDPEYRYREVLMCTKVPYDESGFKVPSNQI